MTNPNSSSPSRFDAALSARLRQLDAMPIDTSALDRALRQAIPIPRRKSRWMLRLVAVAAGLILTGSVAMVLLIPGEVMASPTYIAEMHREMVATASNAMDVANVATINAALHAQWGDFPGIPQMGPSASLHMHDCCIRKMKDARMAFVMLDADGHKISMAVAKSRDVASPKSATMQRDGATFSVQKVGDLNMVMTERGPRWICLTGDLPPEKLMDIAAQFAKD